MSETISRKLLLINPANKIRKGFLNDGSTRFMPLGLGIVAALTPAHWEVELLDESFEDFDFRPADLVAFTSFTSNAFRAYEIAAVYRKAGIHTVMGGVHATMYTEEALKYMDTVVTGEAEGAWPSMIADFESGKVQALYEGGINDVRKIPHIRREIYTYPYAYDLVQTSRGCPWGCDFCSVTQMCGKIYRERDVEDVLDELEETTRPMVFFVDDNLVNDKKGSDERAIRLFKGMVERGLKKCWLSQAALNFADNDEVLSWARKSGCVIILMGIEAENKQALRDVKKNLNLKRGTDSYAAAIRKMHKHGIAILASIIFGMESDTAEDLHARAEFIKNSAIDAYQASILTPLPGTTLLKRMEDQNRIVLNDYPVDWQHYHFARATIATPNLSPDEIETSMQTIWVDLYNKETMRKKMFRTLWNTKSFITAYWAYASNHNYGRIFLEGTPITAVPGLGWNKFRHSLFLNSTDKIIWIIYQLVWTRMIRTMTKTRIPGAQR
jgi:radical SAM superfamily enzyme YgiQ (UPF0313 family)